MYIINLNTKQGDIKMLLEKHHPDYKSFYFVSGTLKENALRKFKKVVRVKNGVATATNGTQLYQAPVNDDSIADGFYLVSKRNKSSVIIESTDCEMYPDLDTCISDWVFPNFIDTSGFKNHGAWAHYIAAINRKGITAPITPIQYVLDSGCLDIQYKDDHSPLLFKNDTLKAYIMPMVQN